MQTKNRGPKKKLDYHIKVEHPLSVEQSMAALKRALIILKMKGVRL